MATPPKLPPDAFKQAGHEPESPFDVISSAPKPVARKQREQLTLPTWAGRYPIAAHDHATQLDMDAAVNEFGLKMPREQAEDEAYRQYLYHPQKGQHAQAALHHLRGMKAAHAAGDTDTARNHSLMLGLHAKALGKQPHEVALDLQSQMQNLAPMSKFKSHRGDAFAATTPPPQEGTGVIASSPPPQLNKREQEVLHMLYLMGQAALAKGEVVGEIHGVARKQPRAKKPFDELGHARAKKWAHAEGYETKNPKKCPYHLGHKGTECSLPGGHKGKHHFSGDETQKAEMKSSSKHCKCPAYKFPHRHGGGKCKESK